MRRAWRLVFAFVLFVIMGVLLWNECYNVVHMERSSGANIFKGQSLDQALNSTQTLASGFASLPNATDIQEDGIIEALPLPSSTTSTPSSPVTNRTAGTPSTEPLSEGESVAARLVEIYKWLCDIGAWSVGRIKHLPPEQRDTLMLYYAPLIEAPAPAPLSPRPGGKLNATHADCKAAGQGKLARILTGRMRSQGPRMIVDMSTGMGGGAELDLLELRLHELDGVADLFVVTESFFGNRCDRKLMHFERQKSRFTDFLPRIVHVKTENCPLYMKKADKCHRKKTATRSAQIYFQEEEQRACSVTQLVAKQPDLPNDALIINTDLDEIPNGYMMNLLKHCEMKDAARFPFRMQQQIIRFSMRSGCPGDKNPYNKGTIELWGNLKKNDKRMRTGVWHPAGKTDTIPRSATHLTAVGSRVQLDYRYLNHGESGQILPLKVPGGGSIGICAINNVEQVQQLQQQISEDPNSILYPKEKQVGKLKEAKLADFANCNLPWPLVSSPRRYPFLWGNGILS